MAELDFTSRAVTTDLRSFSGGLNSTSNRLQLADNELSDLVNIDFNKFGSAIKRNGYTAVNTSAFNSSATFTSLHWFEKSNGDDFLIGTAGDKIAKMEALDGTWDGITGGLTVTAGDSNRFSWITFKDTAYGTNNVDLPVKYDGTGTAALWTTVTGVTKAKFTETWENYVFLAAPTISGTFHATRLYWSCINKPETWDATDFNEIGFKDGQDITGLKALGDRLVVFKERSIWIVFFTGTTDIPFTFHKTQSDVGCISHFSIQEVNNGLMFASADGIYFFDGNNSIKVSNKINNTINNFKASAFTDIVSGYQQTKNRYWASYRTAGGSTNDRIVTFDTFNNAFSIYDGMNANAIEVLEQNGEEKIVFGDFSGFTYQADTGLDDNPLNVSTAIDAFLHTRWFDFGDLANVKALPNIVVYYECKNATLSFAYTYDLQDGDEHSLSFSTDCGGVAWDSGVWDTATWGREGGSFRRIPLTGRGRVIRFKFNNSTLSETFEIHGIGFSIHLETDA